MASNTKTKARGMMALLTVTIALYTASLLVIIYGR